MHMRFAHFLILAAALLAGSSRAEPAQATCTGEETDTYLAVQVTDIRRAKGEVAITVYPDNSERFLAPRGKLARQRVPAAAPTTEACFNLPGPGFYAVAIYHDENANRDFDRTLIGLPDEGFGFSNDAPTSVGLPSFEDVRFNVTSGSNTILIHTRYP
jgi:uncharacterized protein (DUF2141 family)